METNSPSIALLRSAYAAFNARDIDAVFNNMAADVVWPRAFKGGFVRGYDEIRAYWTEQWSEIDGKVTPTSFDDKGDGQVLVDVHQVVRDLDGTVLSDSQVQHLFTIDGGLIQAMELIDPSR